MLFRSYPANTRNQLTSHGTYICILWNSCNFDFENTETMLTCLHTIIKGTKLLKVHHNPLSLKPRPQILQEYKNKCKQSNDQKSKYLRAYFLNWWMLKTSVYMTTCTHINFGQSLRRVGRGTKLPNDRAKKKFLDHSDVRRLVQIPTNCFK